MCRHPGCRGNQSKVVSKRQCRALQCSRKTAAQACTACDGTHSSTHHTHTLPSHRHGPGEILMQNSVSPEEIKQTALVDAWESFTMAGLVNINNSLGNQSERNSSSKHFTDIHCLVCCWSGKWAITQLLSQTKLDTRPDTE